MEFETELSLGGTRHRIIDLPAAAAGRIGRMPHIHRILLENVLRTGGKDARAARSATRLGADAAVGTVGRRTVDVVLRPAAGVDVPAVAATEAVEREFAAIDAQPALAARVRVQPTGRVDG